MHRRQHRPGVRGRIVDFDLVLLHAGPGAAGDVNLVADDPDLRGVAVLVVHGRDLAPGVPLRVVSEYAVGGAAESIERAGGDGGGVMVGGGR